MVRVAAQENGKVFAAEEFSGAVDPKAVAVSLEADPKKGNPQKDFRRAIEDCELRICFAQAIAANPGNPFLGWGKLIDGHEYISAKGHLLAGCNFIVGEDSQAAPQRAAVLRQIFLDLPGFLCWSDHHNHERRPVTA
ncbi:hypothetical protein SBA5_920012 [Candidatus Sulfotelmatomonas gaucii]|uniref:Uncharacterized protein n=1 Tax=Candidatus Sulfuritelmatomonas gaucii TaxID=2043161 RepID=A0A2N9M965_9BACT|nr:hypothetical protein SBA5_920012 [Candidatus Sulfotelmatomonas gaucii]